VMTTSSIDPPSIHPNALEARNPETASSAIV
jgi:hypothetical protein